MKIASISTVYPNPREPGLGPFVRARLQAIAPRVELTVIAPVPAIDYSNPRRDWLHGWRVPARRMDGDIETLHPRWLFPPGGSPLNPACLFLRLAGTLVRLRQRFPFDVIDAHFAYPEGVAAALLGALFRRPFSITLRGSEPGFARRRYAGACIRWALRRADAVVVVSEELRRFAVACGADLSRVHLIPNGVDGSVFHTRDREACRSSFGMGPGAIAIACAGELIEAKGHHLIIEAVRDLVREGWPVHLYIAGATGRGGADFARQIQARIVEWNLGHAVHILGWLDRERLAELLNAADVFCLASYTEGWPNVVNEALACGAPVVATRVGAVPEMIPDERYGIITPPHDTSALRDALRRALSAAWDRRAIAAWGRSRRWEDVARETIAVLTSACHGTRTEETLRPADRGVTHVRD